MILDRDPAPKIKAILWWPVLKNKVGGPAVMRNQLQHLLDLAQRPNITIQVLPEDEFHVGMTGNFTVFAFDDAEPDVVALPARDELRLIEEKTSADAYTSDFLVLEEQAHPPLDTLDIIRTRIKEIG
ncbi:hypothetical protein D5S17_36045 [Pseudonocardiaceae bacterium YIM PH 21723]|nr:hypothetical protein D5S17_36045 [Pseudonocardiaceae bacterium YIM PH 21723]